MIRAPMSMPAMRKPIHESRSRSVIATSPRVMRLRATRWPTRYPTRYMRPYHRRAIGPIRMSSGEILGYGIVMRHEQYRANRDGEDISKFVTEAQWSRGGLRSSRTSSCCTGAARPAARLRAPSQHADHQLENDEHDDGNLQQPGARRLRFAVQHRVGVAQDAELAI